MQIVMDANIVFSALLIKGKSYQIFKINEYLHTFEFVAPEFLFLEIGRRMDKLLAQSHLSKKEISESLEFIKNRITFFSLSKFEEKMPLAKQLNPGDAPYLALALSLKCSLISGDKGLQKQKLVKVITPSKALAFLRREIKKNNS